MQPRRRASRAADRPSAAGLRSRHWRWGFSEAEGASFIDFGSAHQLGTKHVAQTTASPIYMPPEVILGKADSHTQASDMYALALVTYQLIQQEFPFDKERVCVNEAMFKDAVKCGSRESVPDITTSPRLKKVSLKKIEL